MSSEETIPDYELEDVKIVSSPQELRAMGHRVRSRVLDLLLDLADNISPGLAWPPRQTTICPLGPSAASPHR